MSRIVKELTALSRDDLQKKIVELKSELVEQRRSRAANELTNPYAIKKTRRTLAVALTLLNAGTEEVVKKEEA